MRPFLRRYAVLGLAFAALHFAVSIGLIAWIFDESLARQKAGLPPTREEQVINAVLQGMHPLTLSAAFISGGIAGSVPLSVGLALGIVDSLLYGFVAAWLFDGCRRLIRGPRSDEETS